MKAIRVTAYQNMPCYRKPASFVLKESYPLPPYSGVIGMIHAACSFEDYVDMDVSIQGEHYCETSELYTKYEFNRNMSYEKPKPGKQARHNVKMTDGEHDYGMSRGIGNIELLVDVYLLLHIVPKDEAMLETIRQGLENPKNYLSLGRWEDILRIDSVELTELAEETLEDGIFLPYDAYIPKTRENKFTGGEISFSGTMYRLNKKYIIEPKSNLRKWQEKVEARYTVKGSRINSGETLLVDKLPVNSIGWNNQKRQFLPVFLG